jgi:2-C-methyl-D-erythritol 4-phosphate cytidylyltransferase
MVTTSLPTIDTVIIAEDGRTETSVPVRSTVFCDQGPQTFRLEEFKRLQSALSPEETAALIEAGKMYLAAGKRVGIVPGDRMNFKITTEFDLALAECLLRDGVGK